MSNGRKIADLVVGTNVKVTVVDSDLDNIIGSLKTRLDSDDAKLQSIDTAINAGLVNLADSDLIMSQLSAKINSAVANIDSDSTAIQSANTQIAGIISRLDSDDGRLQALNLALAAEISSTNTDISTVKSRMDSDDGKLQALDTSITVLNTRLDSDSTAISAAKTLIGQAVAGQGMADSDLKVVADLRNNLDSEIESAKNIIVTYTNILYRATAGQTTFTGTDIHSVNLEYTVGSIQVFLNGIKLEDEDYTATSGSSIVLAEPVQLNAELSIIVPTLSSSYVPYTAPNWATIVTTAILEGDAFNQVQGETVALNKDGTILVVGVRNYKIGSSNNFGGAVRVYKKSSGTWTLKQLLLSNQQIPNVNFYYGKSLAIASDNDTIIVGHGLPAPNLRGIHIWTSSDNGESWSTQANVLGTDTGSGDNFGSDDNIDISDDGNTMIVGSRFDDDTASDSGAVYVFTRSGTTWSQTQKLKASDAQQSDAFGINCSISGDGNYIIVGAPYEDTGSGASSNGKVYIFNKSGSTWSQQASFQSSETDANDQFGSAVSIDEDGDTAVISASHDSARNAYVFVRSGTSWSQQQKLVHPSAASGDNFGYGSSGHDISGDGNTIYIGSNGDDDNGNNAGRGFVLTRTGTTWSIVGTNVTPLASTYAPGNLRGVEAQDYYGSRLAISRDGLTVAGGGEFHNNNSGSSTGAAYVMVPANLA